MKSLSTRTQILILALSLSAISLVSLIVITLNQINSQLRRGMEQKAISLCTITAASIGPGLEFQDSAFVGDYVQAMLTDEDVVGIHVFDENEVCIYEKTRGGFSADSIIHSSTTDTLSINYFSGYWQIFKPIFIRDKKVGGISLAVSENSVVARIKSSIGLILVGAFFVMAIVIMAAYLISRLIVKPITIFEDASNKIRDGDMAFDIEVSSLNRDFRSLGTAFNKMRTALESAFDELNLVKIHLEEQVQQRTSELQRELAERNRAEEALRESEAKYRTLFDTANDAIFIMQDDRFIDCNAHTLEMFGCKWEQIVGESPYMFSPVYQPDGIPSKDRALEKIKAAMDGTPQSFEWLHCKLDRTPFHAEVNLSRMEFNDKTYLLAIVRDITERKKAEEQKRAIQEKLERAERMESLGILAGGIAHDLNNMLGPLVGYPELLLMKLPQDSPIRKQIERIAKSAQGAADVVQDLLTLARRGRYEMVPTDINEIVEAYLDSPGFERLIDKHPDVKITITLEKPIGQISGSFHHLLKVFMNLVVNAFDAMPEGGELVIESKQRQVEKLASGFEKIEKGDYIILSVRDTGMGIDPKDFAKIFEPYYSKKKMGTSGSGLGLSVVYGIVKDHKAYYDVLSEVGKGTEFILYFPVGGEKSEQKASVVQEIDGSETILVVDDMEEQREMAAELLASMNYQISTACNGREAVEYLKSHRIDIVMLDMIMENDFDGLDTYREILKIYPGQKAIVVSGFSATDRVMEMKRLGVGEYVKKPYTREALGLAIRNTLNREMVAQTR